MYLVWDFDGTLATRQGHWPGTLCEVIARERPDLTVTAAAIRPHLQAGFPWHAPDVVRGTCSADIGSEKPHRNTFEAVFAHYPAARNGWMIGDSWRADVQGAHAVGMRAILVRERHPEAPVQCDTLHDVVRIVGAP